MSDSTAYQDVRAAVEARGRCDYPGNETSDGEHVFSVHDFMDLACPNKCDSWTSVTWTGLIAENSKYKHELEYTMITLKYLGVRNGRKTRNRKTPVMTLQGLQRLLVIVGGKVAAEFRQIVLGVFTRYMAGTGPWSSWST